MTAFIAKALTGKRSEIVLAKGNRYRVLYLGFRRFVLICIVLSMVMASVTAQELALDPLPDRVAAKFTAIGRLGRAGFKDKQGCTATLIAPDLVLTAAHCVSDKGRSGRIFVAGWSRGDYIASRPAVIERRHPEYAANGQGTPANDVALVVLESPIEDVTPIPLGEAHAATLYGTKVALIGYHRKTPHVLSGGFSCNVGRFAKGLLHLGCPVISGNSGSPVLRWKQEGGWQVVGVVSSQIGAGAIAVELPEWIKLEVAAHQSGGS